MDEVVTFEKDALIKHKTPALLLGFFIVFSSSKTSLSFLFRMKLALYLQVPCKF